jgi:hypothetical protein
MGAEWIQSNADHEIGDNAVTIQIIEQGQGIRKAIRRRREHAARGLKFRSPRLND